MNTPDHPLHPGRRALLLAGGSLLMTGCVSDSLSLIGETLGLGNGGRRYPLDDAQIAAIPYASLGVRIGRGTGVVMILASIDGEDLHWASADRVVLVTRRGRLVKTVGLSRDLLASRAAGADPLAASLAGDPAAAEARVDRLVDLRPDDDFGVPVESRWQQDGEETIRLLGSERRLLRIRERVVVRKWRWSTDNLYWLDRDSGRVWRSRQQYCPQVEPITMELLKPVTGVA